MRAARLAAVGVAFASFGSPASSIGLGGDARAGARLVVIEGTERAPPAESAPPGVVVRTRRPALRFEVGALVQVLAGREAPSAGMSASGFRVRRSRLYLDGQLERTLRLTLHLELEVNPRAELVDAPLADAWLGFDAVARALADIGRLRVGQLKVPFGGELQTAPESLVFVERNLASRCLGPGAQVRDVPVPDGPPDPAGRATRLVAGEATGRDVGLRYDLDVALRGTHLLVGAGLFGGVGPNRLSPVAPLYVARVAVARGDVADRNHLYLEVGASWAYGARVPYRDRCSFPLADAELVDVHRAGGDVRFRLRWITVGAEAIAAIPRGFGAPGVAWSAGGWVGVEPLPEFLEIAGRVEAFESPAERFLALTASASLRYFGDRFRLQYNYTRRFSRSAGVADSDGHLVSFLMSL